MNKFKKIFTIIMMATLLFGRVSYFVYAEEAVPAGEAQPAAEAVPGGEAEAGEATEAGEAVSAEEAVAEEEIADVDPVGVDEPETSGGDNDREFDGTTSDGNVGDTLVRTGDADNTGTVYNTGNTNLAGTGDGSCCSPSVSVVNNGNGADSSNNGSATIIGNNNTNQTNGANILNDLNQTSITGDNSASKNVGDSEIITGNANVTGTVITAANTNVAGVGVSEFNIVDDHNGDFVLDFGANCISGCGEGNVNVANTSNGPNSTNTGAVDTTTNNNIDQLNDGTVVNNVDFLADSGNNQASMNTGGENNITTGDANVAANLLTFLNNNIAGGVMYGVVNIFGDLVGDIILPDNVFDQFTCSTCGGNTNIVNSGNGAGSDNNALVNDITNNNVFQANDANIQNNLYLEAETGGNTASQNNQGDVNVKTGNTSVDASILNIANMNLIGSNMWLVIINEAGNWVGKLFGAPDGSQMAGSEGVEFAVDQNGTINVLNKNNGAGSDNNGTVNNVTNNNLNQSNTANVVNNLNLVANSGNNDASKNNGDVNIKTGDAEAIANIVNFVNNNIAGGKLLVTFVNVFGSWTGDFLTPGSHKESQVLAQGGVEENNSSGGNQNAQNDSSTGASSSQVAKGNNFIAAAGFAGGPSNSNINNNGNSNINIKVAGANTADILSALTKGANKDKVTLNLAWVLLLMPLAALTIVARKIYLKKTALRV